MIETQVDETKHGYVYRITNLINGKTYVGQHKVIKDEKWLTYMGSGRLVRYAIHKYGIENFSKELLGYAGSKSDLDILEKSFIEKELAKGHSEYNINGSDAKLAIKLDELNLNDEDLLKWYFDENMSYSEIALRLNCSIPTIYGYMKILREKDERFEQIKHGDRRGRNPVIPPEQIQKMIEKSSVKVVCENGCGKEISHNNYSRHLNACKNGYSVLVKKHKCANKDCSKMIKKSNLHCKEHYYKFLDNSKNFTPESVKRGGIVASHNRWHVKRGKVSENCELCQENLLK